MVPLLTPHFQLILVELPGLGAEHEALPGQPYYEFCADTLEELRITLEIERWNILAYSTGTRVAEFYIQRYPEHVIQAAFLCPIFLRKSWTRALQIEEWIDSKHTDLANWFLSGWRLYGMLYWLGFNLRQRSFVNEWMNEIELQPLENLKRMLLELPGKGRAPFILPTTPPVPILFIWGSRDALTARPARPRANDVFIFANHGAPMLTPDHIAAIVVPFFTRKTVTVSSRVSKLRRLKRAATVHKVLGPTRQIRTSKRSSSKKM